MTTFTGPIRNAASFTDTAVVMITKNEEAAVGKVVSDALNAAPGAEVVVVDGSTDRTAEIAEARGARVVAEPGGGAASALVAALRASDRPVIVTVDADDTYPSQMIPSLVELVRAGFDVAGSDRMGFGRPAAMPYMNYLANKTFNSLATIWTRRRVRDVHSGMRAYRRAVINGFDWDTRGLALPVDLLLWPTRAGLRIVEVPIDYRERLGQTTLVRWPGTKWTLRRVTRLSPPRTVGLSDELDPSFRDPEVAR
jgi:glycosyltransferase involved in cell wall biosynthesis